MTIVYTPKDAALDIIAITLILLPEPVTTPIGIGILCRKRNGSEHEPTHPFHFSPDYVYKVDNIRGREITWQARTILPGQLPLSELNRPEIKIKEREQYILSRTKPEKSSAQKIAENLPPGVKVHHEIFRPPRFPVSNQPAFIPGETVHHTLRPFPQSTPVINRGQPQPNIHHTIENSPGFIIAQSGGANQGPKPTIIHHTIQDSPAMRQGNPANIIKPVRIVAHHTLSPTPPIMYRGRIIQQTPAPSPMHKGTIIGKKGPGVDRPT